MGQTVVALEVGSPDGNLGGLWTGGLGCDHVPQGSSVSSDWHHRAGGSRFGHLRDREVLQQGLKQDEHRVPDSDDPASDSESVTSYIYTLLHTVGLSATPDKKYDKQD